MDKTVPPGAAMLLDFIGDVETSRRPPEAYDVVYGHNQHKLRTPVTLMTVDEVIAAQPGWSRAFGSSATGRYQFMNATLKDLKRELGLRGSQVMDGNLQDRLGYHLLKRRGYDAFMSGQISRTAFGKALAQEWASLPVLATTKGAKRSVARGQSYYAGDGLNKSLVQPHRVEAVLDAALTAKAASPAPKPTKPAPASPDATVGQTRGIGWLLVALIDFIKSLARLWRS